MHFRLESAGRTFCPGMGNIPMIALQAIAAFFVFKLMFRRNASVAQSGEPLQYAGSSATVHSQQATAQYGSAMPGAAPSPQRVPAGFDIEAFLRIAKLNFVRLQAANDIKNLDDIREFVSPKLYAEVKMQMDARGNAPQQTDVVSLKAELLEVVSESNHHLASVHFSGTIREVIGATAVPFDEVWNLSKPIQGRKGWIVAGIQQSH